MASVYAKGGMLYASVKVGGKWKAIATGFPVGQEAKARAAARAYQERADRNEEAGLEPGAEMTLRQWSALWLKGKERGKADAESHLDNHILPALGSVPLAELRTKQIRAWVKSLPKKHAQQQAADAEPRPLAPRTVRNIYGTLHAMMRAAAGDELIPANPCNLLPDDLPAKEDADPEWRAGAVFTRGEVETLISDERIPEDRRTLYAVLALGGLRFGEAAALRWRNYDSTLEPLGRLVVATSFRIRDRKTKGTKTGALRYVPVHPTLAKVLAAWQIGGWARMLRKESGGQVLGPDNLLIPSRKNRERSVSHALKRFHEDCERVKLRPRRLHDLRRSFISLARDDGANRDVLRWVTHAPPREAFDTYTSFAWGTVCTEVAKLRLALLEEAAVIQLAGVSGGAALSTVRSTGKRKARNL